MEESLPGTSDGLRDEIAEGRLIGSPSGPGVTWEVTPGATGSATRVRFLENGESLGELSGNDVSSALGFNDLGLVNSTLDQALRERGFADPTTLLRGVDGQTP